MDSGRSEGYLRIGIRAVAVGVASVRDVNGRGPSESHVARMIILFGGVSGTLVEEEDHPKAMYTSESLIPDG
jgi:hypothetical protein